MYRAPEMIDLYSNSPVTEKADIWVSYTVYTRLHPRPLPVTFTMKKQGKLGI